MPRVEVIAGVFRWQSFCNLGVGEIFNFNCVNGKFRMSVLGSHFRHPTST